MIKQVVTLCDYPEACNTYVVSDEKAVIIIDPSLKINNLKKLVGDKKLLAVFLTHGHYDHFMSLSKLLKEPLALNCKLYIHHNALTKLTNVNYSCAKYFGINDPTIINENNIIFIKDQDTINITDNFNVNVIATPGHTNCSLCFVIDDLIFTGDTLFYHGVGRTDLPTSSTISLVNSIKRLMGLKGSFTIYPGHGEMTTLEEERKNNYFYKQTM